MTVVIPGTYHMELASGVYLDVLHPDPALICVDDIAHHLSLLNRYTGATSRPISVAEHTMLVADRLRSRGHGAATILRGLHHDSAEAYAGDVGRPLKTALGRAYWDIESRLDEAIARALGLPEAGVDWRAIKDADDWALSAEAYHLMRSAGRGWYCQGLYDPIDTRNPPATERLRENPLPPRELRDRWLAQHRRWWSHLHPPRVIASDEKP